MKFLSASSILLSDISLESLLFSIGDIDQLSGDIISEDTTSTEFSSGINTLIAISARLPGMSVSLLIKASILIPEAKNTACSISLIFSFSSLVNSSDLLYLIASRVISRLYNRSGVSLAGSKIS